MDKKYIGKKFYRLLILDTWVEKIKNHSVTFCSCECDCGNFVNRIALSDLKRGNGKSCGCLMKELASKRFKKYNKYDLSGEFGIGYDVNNNHFYFDLEDYNKIRMYRWYIEDGYAKCKIKNKRVTMHNLVMGLDDNSGQVDHKNRCRNDNRKENLRFCTTKQNVINSSVNKNSKTGITGVTITKNGKFLASITINGTYIRLGTGENFKDVVNKRLLAEKMYFGEFAPQKHLFEEYGVL